MDDKIPTSIDDILFKYQTERVKLKKSADNPFFKSKYVPLNAILEYIIPKFTDDWILCTHRIENSQVITTLKFVKSWEIRESSFPLNAKDPQKQGSEITYGKRYNLSCLLNIQDTEDDDGNLASSEWNTKEFYKPKEEKPKEPVRESKPKFWDANYRGFIDNKDKFKTYEEAIEKIESVYDIDNHYKEEIKLLYTNF